MTIFFSHRLNTDKTQIQRRETTASQTDGLPSWAALLFKQSDRMTSDANTLTGSAAIDFLNGPCAPEHQSASPQKKFVQDAKR
ncbi:hypothetical protein [Symmachiella dynata]|uniref:hypothetical protein n=1 Tax=Symmachiella dynata TaxID=2527995 RepID=UPI0030EBA12B